MMSKVGDTIRGYIWWTYPRGSFHYDVMVTLILAFIFLTPLFINFGDKPVRKMPHQTEVVVTPNGQHGFIFQVDAAAVGSADDAGIRERLLEVVEPIAGEATIDHYEAQTDRHGNVKFYKVWIRK